MAQNSRTASAVSDINSAKIEQKSTRKKSVDFIIVATLLLLLALGIIMVLSAFTNSISAEDGKQLFICNKTINICGFRSIWYGSYIKNRL